MSSPRRSPLFGAWPSGLLGALCLVGASGACQPKPTEASDSPYRRDVSRICQQEEQSGALHVDPNARALHTAVWLSGNLESPEGRELSRQLSAVPAPERIPLLRKEVKAQQIGRCELLFAWGAKS